MFERWVQEADGRDEDSEWGEDEGDKDGHEDGRRHKGLANNACGTINIQQIATSWSLTILGILVELFIVLLYVSIMRGLWLWLWLWLRLCVC